MRTQIGWILFLGLLVSPLTVQAQVASALLREGDPLATPPGQQVTVLNNTAVDHGVGYAITVTSSGPAGTLSQVWGSHTGGAGEILRTESALGPYVQTSFESFFGISTSPAGIAYSAVVDDTLSGATGLDGVWLDDLPVAVEEMPYPHQAGMYWSFGSRPAATLDGIPFWVGGITSTQGGSTENRGLFRGVEATPLLMGGDMVAGLPYPLSSASTVSFDYRFSALGTHTIAEVQAESGSTTNDNSMVIDGDLLLIDGQPVTEASPVPAAAGGLPGEAWDNFDFAGITEEGTWMFTGDTDADVALDEVIVQNGVITYREGDIVDGELLGGAIEGAYLNANGDIAYIWDIEGGALEALFLNDQLLLRQGDAVDIDGDLIVDPDAILEDFTGISTLTLSNRDLEGRVRIYFTADVSLLAPPVTLEAAFGMTAQVPTSAVRSEGAESSRPELQIAIAPQPVSGSGATIRFAAADARPVTVDLVDILGRPVRFLARGRFPGGWHALSWDGCDDQGRPLAAGIYLVRLRCGGRTVADRITVLR